MSQIEYAYEICEAIEKIYDTETCLYILKELYEITRITYFNERQKQICKEHELCPNCFGELTITKENVLTGEYQGMLAYETINIRTCKNCGKEKGE